MRKFIIQIHFRDILILSLLLGFSGIFSADARLPQCEITILTQAIGEELSSIFPKELGDFWKVIKIGDSEFLIPEVRCLRIDIIPEMEFKPEKPEDSWDIIARKKIAKTWKDRDEREHLLKGIEKQQIGEEFSSKTPSARNPKDIEKTVIDHGKDIEQKRFFVYAPYLKKEKQPVSEVKIGSSLKGRVFTDAAKLMEKFNEQVLEDVKNNEDLTYMVLYNVNLLQLEHAKQPEPVPLKGGKKEPVVKPPKEPKKPPKPKEPKTHPVDQLEKLRKNVKALEEEIKNDYEKFKSDSLKIKSSSDNKDIKANCQKLIQKHKIQKNYYIRLKDLKRAEETQQMIDNLEKIKGGL